MEMTNKGRDWLVSDHVDELVLGMVLPERRIVGRVAESSAPLEYLGAVADTVELLKVDITPAFDSFITEGLEQL